MAGRFLIRKQEGAALPTNLLDNSPDDGSGLFFYEGIEIRIGDHVKTRSNWKKESVRKLFIIEKKTMEKRTKWKKTFTWKIVNYDDIKSLFTINTTWQVTR